MILCIDNFDSFTFNLVQVFQQLVVVIAQHERNEFPAGASVAVTNVLGVGFLPIGIDYLQQWGLPLLAVGGGLGLVVALLGHYFGRDLRAGLTADVEG